MDVRPFVKYVKEDGLASGHIAIRNENEYSLARTRLILESEWQSDKALSLENSLDYAGQVFSTWLSDNITKKFGLDAQNQLELKILSYVYYHSLFREEPLTSLDLDRLAYKIKENSYMEPKFILGVIGKITSLSDIESFTLNVRSVVSNHRVSHFTIADLVTCIGTSWFGFSAKEMLMLSLEHPPTWISIVHAALNSRSWKNSNIATIALKLSKRGEGDNFNTSILNILKTIQ
jgi:hypothetical protein